MSTDGYVSLSNFMHSVVFMHVSAIEICTVLINRSAHSIMVRPRHTHKTFGIDPIGSAIFVNRPFNNKS